MGTMKFTTKTLVFVFLVLSNIEVAFTQTPSPTPISSNAEQALSVSGMVPVIISSSISLLVAIITAVLGYVLGTRTQLAATAKERRQQAYSQILGHEAILSQLLVSRFEAFAYSDYHEALWRLDGRPSDSVGFQEALRWMRKSEDLGLEVARCRQRLYETLGLIRAVFKSNPSLTEKLEMVENHKMPRIERDPFEMNRDDVYSWKLAVVPAIQSSVASAISVPLRELASCLQKQIDADAK